MEGESSPNQGICYIKSALKNRKLLNEKNKIIKGGFQKRRAFDRLREKAPSKEALRSVRKDWATKEQKKQRREKQRMKEKGTQKKKMMKRLKGKEWKRKSEREREREKEKAKT